MNPFSLASPSTEWTRRHRVDTD